MKKLKINSWKSLCKAHGKKNKNVQIKFNVKTLNETKKDISYGINTVNQMMKYLKPFFVPNDIAYKHTKQKLVEIPGGEMTNPYSLLGLL